MPVLTESPVWEPTIHEIGVEEFVAGGPSGPPNAQARQLGNRTLFLKQVTDEVVSARGNAVSLGARLNTIEEAAKKAVDTKTQLTASSYAVAVIAGGFKVLGGTVTTNSAGVGDVSFPVEFPTACVSCVVTPFGGSGAVVISSLSTKAVSFSTSPATKCSWLAIGF